MWSDPIADMLTRIRNGGAVRRARVTVPASKVKLGIAQVMKREGYLEEVEQIEDRKQGNLVLTLRYGPRGEQVIHKIARISKPGRRVYAKVDAIPRVLDGLGIVIVSTPLGVLSGRQCLERNTGGELLCSIY